MISLLSYDKLLNRVYRLLGKVYYQLVVYEHLTFLDIDRFTVWVKDDPSLSTNFMYEGDARNYYNKLLRTNPEVKSSIELRNNFGILADEVLDIKNLSDDL